MCEWIINSMHEQNLHIWRWSWSWREILNGDEKCLIIYALMWFEWKSFCPMRILVSFDSIKLCLCTKTVLTVINSVLLYLSQTEKTSLCLSFCIILSFLQPLNPSKVEPIKNLKCTTNAHFLVALSPILYYYTFIL